jgi:hypothetical protein
MKLGTSDKELRRLLREATAPFNGLREQIERIAALRYEHPHSIALVEENIGGRLDFPCFHHALGLEGFRFKDSRWDKFYIDQALFEQFVGESFTEINISDITTGDLVIYVNSKIEHAGRIVNEAVESKWGHGHIWHHGVYEIPENYGDTLRFFRGISREDALNALRRCHQTLQATRIVGGNAEAGECK